MQTESTQPRTGDRPRLFTHDLDAALFTSERLDALVRQAVAQRGRGGTLAESHGLDVQLADPGRERPGLDKPVFTEPRYPVLEDVLSRGIQYRLYNPDQWAGPEYAACRDRLLELAAPDVAHGRIGVTTTIRVFSPGAVVALHTDVDLKIVAGLTGETVWWVRPPDDTTNVEHENLLHGEFFLRWRESEREEALPVHPGSGCFVPCRWAHWLEHPTDEPVISFEMGLWTREAIRLRKIYDVNWGLRKLGLEPTPPGVIPGRDLLKCRLFDLASRAAGKANVYRGQH